MYTVAVSPVEERSRVLALNGPVRFVATEPGSAIAALLEDVQGRFAAAVVVAPAVAALVAAGPVAGLAVARAAARRPRPKYRSGQVAAARAGRVMAPETPAEARAAVTAHRGSDAAWAGSRRPAFRHPIVCREERAPLHLCKARTGLSYLKIIQNKLLVMISTSNTQHIQRNTIRND